MKKMTIVLTIVTILLGSNNLQLNSIVEAKEENIKILNTKIENLSSKNEELIEYKNIVAGFNSIEISNIDYVYYPVNLTKYEQEYIQNLCYQNQLSYEYILAIIKLESNFQKDAVSNSDCLGLMQINRQFLDLYSELAGIENLDPFDATQNVSMGIAYIIYLRNFWISEGITDQESLFVYISNSYNCGIEGYKNYIKNTGNYSRSYNKTILKYKLEIEQSLDN